MRRNGRLILVIVSLLTVPAVAFFYFAWPGHGYPHGTASAVAGPLAAVGLALLLLPSRNQPGTRERGDPL